MWWVCSDLSKLEVAVEIQNWRQRKNWDFLKVALLVGTLMGWRKEEDFVSGTTHKRISAPGAAPLWWWSWSESCCCCCCFWGCQKLPCRLTGMESQAMQAVMCMAGLMMLVLSHKATQLLPAVQKEERRNSELQHPGGTLYTGVFFFFLPLSMLSLNG